VRTNDTVSPGINIAAVRHQSGPARDMCEARGTPGTRRWNCVNGWTTA
jgi:hypothetical protein